MTHAKLFHRIAASLFFASCAVWLTACADELDPDDGPEPGPHVTHTAEAGGVTRTIVDATAQDAWVYFDVDDGAEVAENEAWDLAFQRFNIKLAPGARAAVLPGVDFAALAKAPASGFQADSETSSVFAAGDGWYAYNSSNHLITARDTVYVVASGEGAHFKLQMAGYYDAAGTSGHPSFRWAVVAAPPASDEITVDATSQTDWRYLRIADGALVTASDDWDLAFRRTQIATHGGASAEGHGGARLAEGVAYDDLVGADTVGFAVDAVLAIPGPPGAGTFIGNPALESWYDYGGAGAVSTKGLTYVVRTSAGGYGKLTITGWTSGVFTVRVAPLPRHVEVHTQDVAAPSGWVYFDLRGGRVVTPTTPADDRSWDLAFSGAYIATNSGTSGGGAGGGADPQVASLDELAGTQAATFTVDTMLNQNPPANGQYSGNGALAAWYDYDMATHVATPKNKAYLVKTADGGLAKLKITGFASGTYTLSWSYAGAGKEEL
jgi:hypothetical protein